MKQRANIGFAILALVIAGGLAFGFWPRAVPVELATATRGPLTVSVEEEGKTRVIERYLVSAPVSGYAQRIELRAGDPVSVGQELAAIGPARADALDPRARAEAAARVQAAAAALAAARENARAAAAQSELAQQEFTRTEALHAANFVSAQVVDKARSELTRSGSIRLAAEHNARVAGFELEQARAVLASVSRQQAGGAAETMRVLAPVAGRVLKLVHESEGQVRAGEPLLEIGNPESLEVEVEILSAQAVKIRPGGKVLFERWGGEQPLTGVVRVVEPAGFTKVSALGVEEQRVRVIVDFSSPREEWARLGDAYRVEARFVLWEGEDVLQVPASALLRDREGWAVFVVEGGRARLRAVQIGQSDGLRTEILAGLKAGDTLVAQADDTVGDGVRVQAR